MNPRTKSQDIRDLSQNDIRDLVAELGQPTFRAKQLIEWVFEKNVCSFDDMTNLPKAFREQLKEAFAFDTPTELTKQVSKDGSRKYLLEYHDGISVETVGMPRRNKLSVCVSTQAGCAMGCAFCASCKGGLKRNLTAAEMQQLQPEVAREPAMALEAGEDGLVFYRALAEHYQNALRPGGALALEIGWQQREAVTALLAANGWVDIACRKDYGGNDRCILARRSYP